MLGATFAVLYAALSPDVTRQGWDSLSYAHAAETPGLPPIWGNHPLGHAVLDLTLWIARHFGYAGRALPLLLVVGSFFGGLAITCFFLICNVLIGADRRVSLSLALILGGSYSLWRYAGSADIYSFSLLLCAAAWAGIIYHLRFQTRPGLAGALAGLATLGHQLNGILVLPGVFLILTTEGRSSTARRLFRFVGGAALVVVIGYGVFGYLVTSSTSPLVLATWAKGYFGDPTYGRHLHVAELPIAVGTLTGAVIHRPAARAALVGRDGLLVILLLLTLGGIVPRKRVAPSLRWLVGGALLHCGVAWSLIWWWEPFNDKFWVLTLIPWLLILACSDPASSGSTAGRVVGIFYRRCLPPLAVGVLLCNFLTGILPDSAPNLALRNALSAWARRSKPHDVLIPTTDLVAHLLYWENRPDTLLLYRILQAAPPDDPFHVLRTTIDAAIERQAEVLYTPAAVDNVQDEELALLHVSREALRGALASYEQQEAFSYADVGSGKRLQVYELRAPHTAAAR